MIAEIERKNSWVFIHVATALAVASLVLGLLKGPDWAVILSSVGIFSVLINGIFFIKNPETQAGWMPMTLVGGIHLILLLAAFVGSHLFLTPLSESSLHVPSFRQIYRDPDGLFVLRGPLNWDYYSLPNGVRIKPQGFNQYMGAAEIVIHVRPMDKIPASEDKFLQKMAQSTSSEKVRAEARKHKDGIFRLETMPAELLSKKRGMWAELNVNRLWIPLKQVSLFGIKKKKYFCSISISGLEAHSTLFRVLCLGLFETLQIK